MIHPPSCLYTHNTKKQQSGPLLVKLTQQFGIFGGFKPKHLRIFGYFREKHFGKRKINSNFAPDLSDTFLLYGTNIQTQTI